MASDAAIRAMSNFRRLGETEQCLYTPKAGGQRTITVMVDRPGFEKIMQGEQPEIRVTALNDDSLGIPSDPAKSDTGGDWIEVAERVGGPAVARPMRRFVEQDIDFVTVAVG